MKDRVRHHMGRVLSGRAYDYASYLYWFGRYSLPDTLASRFGHTPPAVQGYPPDSKLAEEVRAINVKSRNRLCSVMSWYGSDKGDNWHNYTTVYAPLFAKWNNRPVKIFELGLGTNNPSLISSMGVNGRPGASLRGWREYFPQSQVYGADIDRNILFNDDRIHTFYCDQLDAEAIRNLWAQPVLKDGVDILIEDGLHTFEANISFLTNSLQYVRPGGIYVVEDVKVEHIPQWQTYFAETAPRFAPEYEFALTELPNKFNKLDNILLLIRRAG